MLKFYIGRDNLPEGVHLIYDVEAAFIGTAITGSDFQRLVIHEVDKGEYKDSRTFVDRLGRTLGYEDLSAGSKALLLLESIKDCIINFYECGDNAINLLSYLDEGMIFFIDRSTSIPFIKDYPVVYNGKQLKGVSQMNYWLC